MSDHTPTRVLLEAPYGTYYDSHPVTQAWRTILEHGGREIVLAREVVGPDSFMNADEIWWVEVSDE